MLVALSILGEVERFIAADLYPLRYLITPIVALVAAGAVFFAVRNGLHTVLWRHRLAGVFFASPVGADGKIYLLSETGETFVMRAGREAKLLAQNDLGERFLASPAISNGRIFLRSDGNLFSVGK